MDHLPDTTLPTDSSSPSVLEKQKSPPTNRTCHFKEMEDSSPSSLGIRRRNETTIPPSSHPLSAQTASRTSVSNSSTYNPSQPLSHPSNHPSSAIAAVGSLSSFPLTPLKRRKVIRDLSSMDIEAQVGAGMYGCVYKAVDRLKGDKVALKYIKMAKENQGFPVTAIREIKLLKAMNNENIIRLHDVITFSKPETSGDSNDEPANLQFEDGAVFMVFEYMDFDLSSLLSSKQMIFSPSHVRCYAKQLFSGLHYMHRNNILHRDIKGANILVSRENKLKIADWGLARSVSVDTQKLTNNVVTIWYRCPELLLETTRYGSSIDIWSAGCLFAEMFTKGTAILPSNPDTSAKQLELIYQLCGSPTGETEERLKKCEGWEKYQFSTVYPSRIRERFAGWPPLALDLLEELLCLHPEKRISASDTLNHPFFWSDGGTCQPDSLPRISYRIEAAHEYETQLKRTEESSRRRDAQSQQQQTQLPHHHKGGGGAGRGGGPPGAPPGGRGRSKYRVVTRPSAPSAAATAAGTTASGNAGNSSTTAAAAPLPPQPGAVPAVGAAPTNTTGSEAGGGGDMIVPEHQSAFRKLGS